MSFIDIVNWSGNQPITERRWQVKGIMSPVGYTISRLYSKIDYFKYPGGRPAR